MDSGEKVIGKYRQNNVKKYYEPETMLVEDSLDNTTKMMKMKRMKTRKMTNRMKTIMS